MASRSWLYMHTAAPGSSAAPMHANHARMPCTRRIWYPAPSTAEPAPAQVEMNAGWQGALAGLIQAPGQFSQCLQSYSIFAANYTACPRLNSVPDIH